MGVPAFFKWISARYPLIMQKIYEDAQQPLDTCHVLDEHGSVIPQQVDNLYLDCNGIVHPCCHPEGGMKQPENEEEMFANIHALIDRLFNLTQPKNLLYLALDGVAPRAKMNQQRARRFCSAREFEEQEEAMKELGIPKHDSWDHNQITPGTPFMARLAISLRKYVTEKQHNNIKWQNIVVIIDDSSNPGEGEHKIMDYIRRWRSSVNYSPDITHAVCGQDADLIHLGLALHEPKVLILRERVELKKNTNYSRKNNNQNASGGGGGLVEEESQIKGMDFLNIERLRQYLFFDFYKAFQTDEMLSYNQLLTLNQQQHRQNTGTHNNNVENNSNENDEPFLFNIEKVIDDFIFLCFFVGNDFLPHLPSLSIRDGSLDILIKIYCLILPQLKGYINNEGVISLKRVELLISKFGYLETSILYKKTQEDEKMNKREHFKSHQNQKNHQNNNQNNSIEKKDDEIKLKLELEKLVLLKNEKLVSKAIHVNQPLDVNKSDYKFKYYKQKILNDIHHHPNNNNNNNNTEDSKAAEGDKGEEGDDDEDNKDGIQDLTCNTTNKEEEEDDEGEGEFISSLKTLKKQKQKTDKELMDNLVNDMRKEYMKGLCWVALYYAQKCPSWIWFYPFHYAPFASDLNNLMQTVAPIQFELGEPFSPLTQLMAVLPARSSHCVPPVYRPLMESVASPLASSYDLEFDLDPNNKPAAMRWLWVAKLSFMNTTLLLKELKKLESKLNNEEKIRNSFHEIEILFHKNHEMKRILTSTTTTNIQQNIDTLDNISATPDGGDGVVGGDWSHVIGSNVDGLIRIPKSVIKTEEDPSSHITVHRYHYRLSNYQINKSIVHDSFMVRPPPLIWSVLQNSLPRKEVRLPISFDQLMYIVYYDPTTAATTMNDHTSSSNQTTLGQYSSNNYSYGGYGGGGGGGGYYNQSNGYHQGSGGARGGGSSGGKKKSKGLCRLINTPNGCTYGANCRFSHGKM